MEQRGSSETLHGRLEEGARHTSQPCNNSKPRVSSMRYEGEDHGSKPLDASYSRALKLLTLEAQMALRMDGTAVAINDVQALYGMSDLLKGEPSGLSMAYGLQAEQLARDIIQRCVEQGRLKEQQLWELMGILEHRKLDRDRYQLAIQGERGMCSPSMTLFPKTGLVAVPSR